MSRLPQTLANAKKGSDLRAQGFKTSIHQHEDIRIFVNTCLNEGRNVKYIKEEGNKKFGELMPSKPALLNYQKYHWAKGTDSVALSFDYSEALMNFDAYKELVDLAKVHKTRYELFCEREKTMKIPNSLIQRELLMLKDVLTKLIDIEVRIGIRAGSIAPTINLTNNNNSVNNTINVGESLDESIETIEELIKLRDRLDNYRARGKSRDTTVIVEGEVRV